MRLRGVVLMTEGGTSGQHAVKSGSKLLTLLGMGLICLYCIAPLIRPHVSIGDVHDDLQAIGRDWALVLVLALLGLVAQKRRAGFFGFRAPGWRDVLAMLGVFVATAVVVILVTRLPVVQVTMRKIRASSLIAAPIDVRLGLVLTAAICEEFIFRGFVIEQVGEWSGSLLFGAALSLVLFVLPHAWLYGFTAALLVPAVLGAALTLLYLWRRNLPVCMVMHAAVDGYSLLLVPALMRAHGG
jgi:uncharacterized protein